MQTRKIIVAAVAMLLTAGAVQADVFNMSDPNLTSLQFVPVGNPGNAADTRYETPGYGSVSYSYNIGKYEVTAGQYTEFLNKVAGVDTYSLYYTGMWSGDAGCKIERYAGSGTQGDPWQYRVAADWANRPVNYVSWGDAARFANWLHNGQPTGAQGLSTTEDGAYYLNGATGGDLMAVSREADWKWAITSEDEWYKAAYHKNDGVTGNYFDYPTGSDSVPGRDMNEVTNPGNNANYYSNGYLIGSPYYRTVVGEFELSESPYGTFDQGGNVWEWDEAILSGRGLRGGSCDSHGGLDANGLHASYRDYVHDPGGAGDDDMGFRVSEVPEPASLALLALGGLGLIRRKRK